jgi:S-disulfanyl-L-cysteine oxidoreductase SoxD
MFLRSVVLLGAVTASAFASVGQAYHFGQPATPQEIKRWDIDVRPDGTGLPPGSGTAARGQAVYEANCQACHGVKGQGGIGGRLAGGQGTLASATPVKTVGSYWPYAPTLFDYIHRAMPYPKPGSLSADDYYAVTAYILNLNRLWPSGAKLDKTSLPNVKMPNRNGFIVDPEWRKSVNSSSRNSP